MTLLGVYLLGIPVTFIAAQKKHGRYAIFTALLWPFNVVGAVLSLFQEEA